MQNIEQSTHHYSTVFPTISDSAASPGLQVTCFFKKKLIQKFTMCQWNASVLTFYCSFRVVILRGAMSTFSKFCMMKFKGFFSVQCWKLGTANRLKIKLSLFDISTWQRRVIMLSWGNRISCTKENQQHKRTWCGQEWNWGGSWRSLSVRISSVTPLSTKWT